MAVSGSWNGLVVGGLVYVVGHCIRVSLNKYNYGETVWRRKSELRSVRVATLGS